MDTLQEDQEIESKEMSVEDIDNLIMWWWEKKCPQGKKSENW
jgi:hypothetical protein